MYVVLFHLEEWIFKPFYDKCTFIKLHIQSNLTKYVRFMLQNLKKCSNYEETLFLPDEGGIEWLPNPWPHEKIGDIFWK